MALLGASCLLSIPYLRGRFDTLMDARKNLAGRSPDERQLYFDNPAYPLSIDLAAAVPADSCVNVLAYAGPNAANYYSARLDYLLYPRRVELSTDSSTDVESCEYLAVFQDLSRNLQADPFVGNWDTEALRQRVEDLTAIASTNTVSVYRLP